CAPEGTLNHAGLRVADSEALVGIQERLEAAGLRTRREEGVECCYSRQTKFWASDPDRTLWEIYVLHDDLEERRSASVPLHAQSFAKDVPRPKVLWRHDLGQPVPARVPHDENSVHEVQLEGTFNAPLDSFDRALLLADVYRALRPGGLVRIHGLAGSRPLN